MDKSPKGWKDVSLEKYIEILEVSTNTELDNRTRLSQYYSIVTEYEPEQILKLKMNDFFKLQEKLKWLEMDTEVEPKLRFTIGDTIYETKTNPSDITTGEFIDLNFLLSEPKDIFKHLPMLLSIFYRPIIDDKREEYDADKVPERMELFKKELNANDIHGCVGFFLTLKTIYLTHIIQSFSKKNLVQKKMGKFSRMVSRLLNKKG